MDSGAAIIDLAEARAPRWLQRLRRNDRGVVANVANAMIIFANDPVLTDLVMYNAFTSQHLLTRPPPAPEDDAIKMAGPYPRAISDADVSLLQAYMQRVWSPAFSKASIQDSIMAIALMRQFHPVTDWLTTLVWDRKPRIDTWLSATFDAENNGYHRAVGSKFLIAAVRRVRQPGCKFDYMLILEGAQGIGKSTAVRVLFGDAWFSDSIPPDLSSRDAAMALLGVWCLEFGEIEHLIRNEPETIKAFLSRQADRYRPPYERAYVERPRQGVLLGTTNSDDYLRDSTGNRRIWPVRCKSVDVRFVALNREQMWAEAAEREAKGETIWLNDESVVSGAVTAQNRRMAEDAWEPAILEWALGRNQVRIPDVLWHGLNMPREKQSRREVLRVADILRQNGWQRWVGRPGGTGPPTRIWLAPGREMPAEPEETKQEELL